MNNYLQYQKRRNRIIKIKRIVKYCVVGALVIGLFLVVGHYEFKSVCQMYVCEPVK